MNFEKPNLAPAENLENKAEARDYLSEVPGPGFEKTIRVGNVEFKVHRSEEAPEGDFARPRILVTSVHEKAKTPDGNFGPSGWTEEESVNEQEFNAFIEKTAADWERWAAERE